MRASLSKLSMIVPLHLINPPVSSEAEVTELTGHINTETRPHGFQKPIEFRAVVPPC